jgi:hypothetical protein
VEVELNKTTAKKRGPLPIDFLCGFNFTGVASIGGEVKSSLIG